MTYDSTSNPVRVSEPEPPEPRRPARIAVHPLALLGWPIPAGTWRPLRRRRGRRRKERAR